MEWQTTPPKTLGLYWAYEALDPRDSDVMKVELRQDGFFWYKNTNYFKPDHFSHFMPYSEEKPEPPV